ncbi:MAG: M48 family metallopeptidase [Paraprevotella sp.]|nr:M48 family metallopeptidase [Paraprevotella sp.]
MKVEEIIHPGDIKALNTLKSIPGLPLLMEKVFQYGYDEISWSENITTNLRLSETQMPEIYNRLPPICERFGIPIPELYLQMSPIANAWTSGHSKPYIVVTLGLIKRIKGEELDAVLAHECGHIVCEHVLYQTLANAIFSVGASFTDSIVGILGNVTIKPLKQALIAWSRASELSADRIACLITPAATLAKALARISMIPRYIVDGMDIDTWAQQGKDFEALKDGSAWNKVVRWISNADVDHPFMPVRAYEALQWESSETYQMIKQNPSCLNLGMNKTPQVKETINPNRTFLSIDAPLGNVLSKLGIHK